MQPYTIPQLGVYARLQCAFSPCPAFWLKGPAAPFCAPAAVDDGATLLPVSERRGSRIVDKLGVVQRAAE